MKTAMDAPENIDIDIDDASLYDKHAQTHTHTQDHTLAGPVRES